MSQKVIYENWFNGMSTNDRIGTRYFSDCKDIDIHRIPGYVTSGFAGSSRLTANPRGLILDATTTPTSGNIYAIEANKLYKLTVIGTSFTNNSYYPHTITGGKEVFAYRIASTDNLFYIKATNMGAFALASDSDASVTFDDDWLSTLPTSAANLTDHPHPKIEYNSYVYIADGQYMSRLDGATGTNGLWQAHMLDLGSGWEITSLFPTSNYIGVCAWKKKGAGDVNYQAECKIYFWNGSSSLPSYSIPIEDNKIVSSFNDNGVIYLLTYGRAYSTISLKTLIQEGSKNQYTLKLNLEGTSRNFTSIHPNTMDIFGNKLVFGAYSSQYRNAVFSYGTIENKYPIALSQPHSTSLTPTASLTGSIGMVKQLFTGALYISYVRGTANYWERFVGTNSTTAYLKTGYTDLGQSSVVNYIKIYFKPLVSGDSATLTLETDYGTSHTPQQDAGVISYTLDGAITLKKFDLGGIYCHSLRPVINWSAGEMAISKIIVDYDFIED